MNEFGHILERSIIHFFSATSLILLIFMGLRTLARRMETRGWLPIDWQASLVVAALLVFALSTMREAWDVAHGQSTLKAATDYVSWLLGCGVGAWGLYRFGIEVQK